MRSALPRSPASRAWARRPSVACGLLAAFGLMMGVSRAAHAAPGQAVRLGGIEPQGPASRAVTAVYHNPAMLAAIPGTAVHVSTGVGFGQQRIQRNAIDEQTGEPTSTLMQPAWLRNTRLPFFAGASFYFDPIAVGIGFYDLGSQYQLNSDSPQRYHLAPDADAGCLEVSLQRCPPNGGAVRYQHDLTASLAWNGGPVKLGASLHLPMVHERFAFDNDTELLPPPAPITAQCDDKEDPACAERVGFKGWTQWIPRNGAPSGLDFALTVGAAVSLAKNTITLGARYRTPALRRSGEVLLGGVGLVCRPNPDGGGDESEQVPTCDDAVPVSASVRQHLAQQLAFGGSFLLGRARLWRLDLNLYWLDLCPGGLAPTRCATEGAQTLRLSGLGRDAVALPEFSRFRGASDLYGLDAFARFRAKTNIYLIVAGHTSSPAVRRGATSAAFSEGWRVGMSLGARVRLPQVDLVLVPGYGLDSFLPRRVSPDDALFSPSAATEFESGSGDINSPGADAVLRGRGRPTNAGRYFGLVHTLSFAIMWGERSVLD